MADGGAVGLPTTNRGVSDSATGRFRVSVDWLAASVDLGAVLTEQGHVNLWEILTDVNGYGFHTPEVAASVFCAFFSGTGLVLDKEQRKGTFYKWRYHVTLPTGAKCGQIEFGGPHTMRQDGTPTARIELTGQGCRQFEGEADCDHAERWSLLRAKLASLGGRLSRVDCAFDDLDGAYNLAFAVKLWLSGKFNARGQQPECHEHSDMKGRKGDTINIGSPTSEKFLRIYEKGKEQGDEASPWIRWEVQFRGSTRRELPLDMLTDPAEYMRGAYAALHFICSLARRIEVTKQAAEATLKSGLRHLRRQYGAVLNFLQAATLDAEALGEFIGNNIARPKLPKWADSYLGREVFVSLLDAMRSPRSGVTPATDSEIEELCHAR